MKFHVPRGATAQTRGMLGKKAQPGQVAPQVYPNPPSLVTPPLPLWGSKGTRLWQGEAGCRQTGEGRLTKKPSPPSPRSTGKASGKGSHAGRERVPLGSPSPLGWKQQQQQQAPGTAAAHSAQLPARPPLVLPA